MRDVANDAGADTLALVRYQVNQSERITSLPMCEFSEIIMSTAKIVGNSQGGRAGNHFKGAAG